MQDLYHQRFDDYERDDYRRTTEEELTIALCHASLIAAVHLGWGGGHALRLANGSPKRSVAKTSYAQIPNRWCC